MNPITPSIIPMKLLIPSTPGNTEKTEPKINPKINNIIAELYEVDKPVAKYEHTKGGAINNCAKIKFIFKFILISLSFIIVVAVFISICVISRTVYKRCDLPYY